MGAGRGPGRRRQLTQPPPACLQNSSKARLRSLESLHGFVAAATKELMWLSEKEEEEVGFDWSERNSNMAAKKEAYSVRRGPSVGGRDPSVRWGSSVAGPAPALGALGGSQGPQCCLGTAPEAPALVRP